jgi:hypothetical protein
MKTPDALRSHPLYRADLGTSHSGEWRSSFTSARDDGMVLTVHTFLFNVFVA